MDEVAEASGVSKGTIYLYYNSKDDLLLKSVKSHMRANRDDALGEIDMAPADRLTPSKVKEMLSNVLDRVLERSAREDNRMLMRVLFSESARNPALAKLRDSFATEARSRIVTFLRAADKAGAIVCNRPDGTARALFGLMIGFFVTEGLFSMGPGAMKSGSNRIAIIEFIFHGLGLESQRE